MSFVKKDLGHKQLPNAWQSPQNSFAFNIRNQYNKMPIIEENYDRYEHCLTYTLFRIIMNGYWLSNIFNNFASCEMDITNDY